MPITDESTFKDFTITVDEQAYGMSRDQLVTVLDAEGIDTRNYFDPPLHRQRAFDGEPAGDLGVGRARAGIGDLAADLPGPAGDDGRADRRDTAHRPRACRGGRQAADVARRARVGGDRTAELDLWSQSGR